MVRFYFFIIIFSLSVFAGDEFGNGGDVVYCKKADDISYELLDLYEAREVHHLSLVTRSFRSVEKMAIFQINKFARWEGKKQYIERINSFMDRVQFVEEDLVDIPDSLHVLLPSHCNVKQLAINLPNGKIKIDKRIWNRLDKLNKAALILHELWYEDSIVLGHRNSIKTRYINSHLHASSYEVIGDDTSWHNGNIQIWKILNILDRDEYEEVSPELLERILKKSPFKSFQLRYFHELAFKDIKYSTPYILNFVKFQVDNYCVDEKCHYINNFGRVIIDNLRLKIYTEKYDPAKRWTRDYSEKIYESITKTIEKLADNNRLNEIEVAYFNDALKLSLPSSLPNDKQQARVINAYIKQKFNEDKANLVVKYMRVFKRFNTDLPQYSKMLDVIIHEALLAEKLINQDNYRTGHFFSALYQMTQSKPDVLVSIGVIKEIVESLEKLPREGYHDYISYRNREKLISLTDLLPETGFSLINATLRDEKFFFYPLDFLGALKYERTRGLLARFEDSIDYFLANVYECRPEQFNRCEEDAIPHLYLDRSVPYEVANNILKNIGYIGDSHMLMNLLMREDNQTDPVKNFIAYEFRYRKLMNKLEASNYMNRFIDYNEGIYDVLLSEIRRFANQKENLISTMRLLVDRPLTDLLRKQLELIVKTSSHEEVVEFANDLLNN